MTENELHYLKSILGNLREFRTVLPLAVLPTIGTEVLSDNIDWLDCYIDAKARASSFGSNTWFRQLFRFSAPGNIEAWRKSHLDRGEKYAAMILQKKSGLSESHMVKQLEILNYLTFTDQYGMFRVEPGGDSLDNPCVCLAYLSNEALAKAIKKEYGDDAQIISVADFKLEDLQ